MKPRLLVVSTVPAVDLAGLKLWDARNELHGYVVETEMGLAVHCPTEGDGHIHPLDDEWALDLWDRSTRQRLACWLAVRVGVRLGSTGPIWRHNHGRTWLLLAPDEPMVEWSTPKEGGTWLYRSERDWKDDARLEDGSRWVDAAALWDAVREVARIEGGG